MLIVRGTLDIDDLQSLGLPMAHRFAAADEVVLIDPDGSGFVAKGATGPWIVEYFDATVILRGDDEARVARAGSGSDGSHEADPRADGERLHRS